MTFEDSDQSASDTLATATTRLEALSRRLADFAARWRAWAHQNQPNVIRCHAHAFDRLVNDKISIARSWQRQEFLIVFKNCPGCWRDKNGVKKGRNK